jgi:hypothetical protein
MAASAPMQKHRDITLERFDKMLSPLYWCVPSVCIASLYRRGYKDTLLHGMETVTGACALARCRPSSRVPFMIASPCSPWWAAQP